MENEEIVELPVDQRTITRRCTDRGIAFIKENQKRPFFLYLPYSMPHIPLYVPDDVRDPDPKRAYINTIEHIDTESAASSTPSANLDLAKTPMSSSPPTTARGSLQTPRRLRRPAARRQNEHLRGRPPRPLHHVGPRPHPRRHGVRRARLHHRPPPHHRRAHRHTPARRPRPSMAWTSPRC
jgi:hypothetical protein